jgi:hypothetical protein
MEEIKSLIDFYLTTQVVINFEDALDKLVGLTTEDNYLEITNYIIDCDHPTSELDLSIYICEIAKPVKKGLTQIINTKLKTFKDNDAIECLEDALKKINYSKFTT